MKEDNHNDRIIGEKLASYEEMPEKLTFGTVRQNYLKQSSTLVRSSVPGKIAIALVSVAATLALTLMTGDHTKEHAPTKAAAARSDSAGISSERSSVPNDHLAGAREEQYAGATFHAEENSPGAAGKKPLPGSGGPETFNAPGQETVQKKMMERENEQAAKTFQPALSKRQDHFPVENKNLAEGESSTRKRQVVKDPETGRSAKESTAQQIPEQKSSDTEKRENAQRSQPSENNLEDPAKGSAQDHPPANKPRGKENVRKDNGRIIPPAPGEGLADEIGKNDRGEERAHPNSSQETPFQAQPDQNEGLKNAGNIPAANSENTDEKIDTVPAGDKTLASMAATVVAQDPTIAAPAVKADFPPSPHRFFLSSELTWNTLTSKLSPNTAVSDHNDAQAFIAEQSQMKAGVLNGSILFGYMYKNACVDLGASLLQLDNRFNTRPFSKTADVYGKKINTTTSITTSVIISTTTIPAQDTLSPPVVITLTTVTTVTVTRTDSVYAFLGSRTYVIVNGDTVSPGEYISSARFFAIPLRFSYAFPVLDNKLTIEPAAGVNFYLPMASQQLVLEKDRQFSYIKTRRPFNNFLMFDGSLKISYRIGRNSSVYLKQGVAMSGKNIYRKDYPLVYKISNIYSTFGLSLMFN